VSCGVYQPMALTAADPMVPCGTRVRVTRVDNGRSVTVVVNDHGSLIPGEVIQLSQAAMDRLGGLDDGVVHVKLSWGR
jgi:rare lipoprotein A